MLGNCCGQATSVAQQQPFPRASTLTSMASHSRGADSARGLHEHCPSRKERGSRECRVRAAPAVSCARCTRKCAHEHTGSAETLRHSLRDGFTAYALLSSVSEFVLSPSLADQG